MKTMKVVVVVVALAIALFLGTEATLYTVGDDLGWTIPPGGAATYAAWAAKYSFVVNDELKFNFEAGEQDLAYLKTADDYESCNTTEPVYLFQYPETLKFVDSGTFYFASTMAGHCAKGQKIAVSVSDAASPSPSPYSSSAQDSPADHLKFVAHRIIAKGN